MENHQKSKTYTYKRKRRQQGIKEDNPHRTSKTKK
jgi:hypothetical protein